MITELDQKIYAGYNGRIGVLFGTCRDKAQLKFRINSFVME